MKEFAARVLRQPIRFFNEILIHRVYKGERVYPLLQEMEKTLVLVPHVDDEVIGLGGYLLSAKSSVTLCYTTESDGELPGQEGEDLSNRRKKEAEELREILGLEEILYLGNKEGQFKEGFPDTTALKRILEEGNYDRVFTVSPYDAHPIHRKTTQMLARVLEDSDINPLITFYEVSNLLPDTWINRVFSLSKRDHEAKEELYSIFESQTEKMDFDIFQRLNLGKGRSLAVPAFSAEFFAEFSKKEFLRLMEDLSILTMPSYRIGNHRSFRKTII